MATDSGFLRITEGTCNYRNPNMDVGKLNSADSGHLKNVNRMVE